MQKWRKCKNDEEVKRGGGFVFRLCGKFEGSYSMNFYDYLASEPKQTKGELSTLGLFGMNTNLNT